jgi:hypothetical protein
MRLSTQRRLEPDVEGDALCYGTVRYSPISCSPRGSGIGGASIPPTFYLPDPTRIQKMSSDPLHILLIQH